MRRDTNKHIPELGPAAALVPIKSRGSFSRKPAEEFSSVLGQLYASFQNACMYACMNIWYGSCENGRVLTTAGLCACSFTGRAQHHENRTDTLGTR